MRRARIAGLTALVLSVTAGLPVSAAFGAGQADAGTLHVNNAAGANCSDTAPGSGSAAVPFCTISAAAKVVTPGQTVQIAGGRYAEEVHLTRSGEPGAPITFTGPASPESKGLGPVSVNETSGYTHAFFLDGVHDINVKHVDARGAQEAVLVQDSSRVTVDDASVPRRPTPA
ncbi:hypothetical protein GCM10010193_08760 [Kitasatospora atroaurantiaca]|uniref:DUF1565 domain-containing protein n=1 Tax=Kitasatospora atroaurantiaca TaxID=285545 RepID=A0A561ERT6_9ACTN|nr:hypothetical protein [Kitasatospora atroaurantiaca]TWE18332.1 hypothetical protein FB465_3399 [Kitasatospora atroaurantiaca]